MADESGLPPGLTADVKALIEMMARGGIADLSLETGAVKLRLRAGQGVSGVATGVAAAPPAANAGIAAEEEVIGTIITAPMIGTFYRAAKPGEPPFIEVGDAVEVGQTIGIIEAMKTMNEIAAEAAGTVTELLVGNGQAVEFGQPLLRLEPPPQA